MTTPTPCSGPDCPATIRRKPGGWGFCQVCDDRLYAIHWARVVELSLIERLRAWNRLFGNREACIEALAGAAPTAVGG